MLKKLQIMLSKTSIFNKILFYFMLPVAIFCVANIYTNIYYSNELKKNVVQQQNNALNLVSNSLNKSLQQVVTTSNLLMMDESVRNMMYNIGGDFSNDVSRVRSLMDTLTQFKNTSSFISGVALVDRINKQVYSTSSKSTMEYYFTKGNQYEDYSLDFWVNKSISNLGYEVLAPTKRTHYNKYVVPLITSGFSEIKSKNIMIIDIDCEAIADVFLKTDFPANGSLYIFDVESRIAIESAFNGPDTSFFKNDDFVKLLKEKKTFNYKIDGKEHLITGFYAEQGVFKQYMYVSVISLSELFQPFLSKQMLSILITAVAMIFVILLVYILSKRLYSPIQEINRQLAVTIPNNHNQKEQGFDFINKQLETVIHMNQNMKEQLNEVLPLVCENYILNFLTMQNDTTDVDMNMDSILHKNGIFFEEDYFMVASIKFIYTEEFYLKFDREQHAAITTSLNNLFLTLLSSECTAFALSPKKSRLILILNVQNSDIVLDNVVEILTKILTMLEIDKDLLYVNIGIGNIYLGYEGMRHSYEESQNISIMQITSHKNEVAVYNGKKEMNNHFIYTIDDENKLFTCMLKGDVEETEGVIREIIGKNMNQGTNPSGINLLYQQFYNTAVKVLGAKDITEDILMQENYIKINMAIDVLDTEKLIEYINLLILETVSYSNLSATRLDMKKIVNYIEANCSSDIYLENIAQVFDTSAKYLSRILKQHLGICFGEYLARLRVEKAKKLLSETDMLINDIITECGFYSRNTFIRTFKKYTGVVPSEYRHLPIEKKHGDNEDTHSDEE